MKKPKSFITALGIIALLLTALPAQASSLTSTQISAIVSLLQSFGADTSVVANVQATLNGQATTGTNPSCVNLSYDLYGGVTDEATNGEVTLLQEFLGISPTTGYFGPQTEQAVQNWQAQNSIVSSGSPDTTGYGYVGSRTRSAMGCRLTQPMTSSIQPSEPSATIDQSSLKASTYGVNSAVLVTLTGSASNVTELQIFLDKANGGTNAATANVTGDRWSTTFLIPVYTGTHLVTVLDADAGSSYTQTLTTGTLTVTSSADQPSATIIGPRTEASGNFSVTGTVQNSV